MKISTKGRYALRLMQDLAEHSGAEPVPLKEIARRQEISDKYLEQIITQLNKAGYVTSTRGAQGGYRLNGDPSGYTVGMILRLVEGSLAPVECLDHGCERSDRCAAYDVWKNVQEAVEDVVDSVTLADLVEKKKRKCAGADQGGKRDRDVSETQDRIRQLKKEKNALILAHYYQTLDIQAVADHVCDSFEMARRAAQAAEPVIVICGVYFMAESAKILSPEKTVLIPVQNAGCPMADMIGAADVRALRKRYPDAAVVCYVNSSAEVKAESDVCCTSSSAERIVRSLPNRRIIFIPDKNLGRYIAYKVLDKEIILYEGFCPPHNRIVERDITQARAELPSARILVHPECRPEVLRHADFIGSTAQIIEEARRTDAREIVIGTEMSVAEKLAGELPEKRFYTLSSGFVCPNMKKIKLADVLRCLETGEHEVTVDPELIAKAKAALDRMVAS